MREMAVPLSLAAHSAVADFESCRRLPASDILAAYERFFCLAAGSLIAVRQRALAERAALEAGQPSWPAAYVKDGQPGGALQGSRRPAQLPHDAIGFAGRQAQLRKLHALLGESPAAGCPAAVVICSIDGIAGVGKSALAVHFAHQVADRFPDGQLYLDLRGHSAQLKPLTPAQALGHLLRALGAATARLPTDPAELAALYRTMLVGRRILIVLDNAADTSQVRPLLPGSGGCVALLTSRRSMAGLVARDGAHRILLGALSSDEALDLLVQVLGPARVAEEPDAAARICELCGYLPLALRIAAERASARERSTPLARLAGELGDERTVLSSLAAEDDEATAVRAAFSWSYRELPDAQARFFRLLARHPGASFTLPAAAALAALSTADAGHLLARLASAHLVEEIDGTRYRLHDLMRVYGLERFAAEDSAATGQAAIERLTTWYLLTAQAAARQVRPARRHPPPQAAPAGIPEISFSGYDDALRWLDAEYAQCLAAATAAHHQGFDGLASAMPAALYDVFELRGLFEDWEQATSVALAAARRLGDLQAQATLLSHRAIVGARTGRPDEALDLLRESLPLRREINDRRGEAATLGNIGNILNDLGRPAEALPFILDSAAIHREIGDNLGEAMSLGNIGYIYERQGRHQDMIEVSEQALPLFQALGDLPGEARALCNLAAAHTRLRHGEPAIAYGRRALDAGRSCGARDIEALALRDLGHAYRDQGQPELALACWRDALRIFQQIGDPEAADVQALIGGLGAQ